MHVHAADDSVCIIYCKRKEICLTEAEDVLLTIVKYIGDFFKPYSSKTAL